MSKDKKIINLIFVYWAGKRRDCENNSYIHVVHDNKGKESKKVNMKSQELIIHIM